MFHAVTPVHGGMNFCKKKYLFEEGDKCLFSKTDIVVPLPPPRPLGGTRDIKEQFFSLVFFRFFVFLRFFLSLQLTKPKKSLFLK